MAERPTQLVLSVSSDDPRDLLRSSKGFEEDITSLDSEDKDWQNQMQHDAFIQAMHAAD